MPTFKQLSISKASFAAIRTKLVDGLGFFEHAPYRYVVADSDLFRLDVVRRKSAITFSQTVAKLTKQSSRFKVVINGNYFTGAALYARAQFGALDPTDVDSVGDVRKGGSTVLPDAKDGADYFFFGRDNGATPNYIAGQGNPPGTVFEGMGGLGPIILSNPVTGAPLKFGAGNRYASNPKKSSVPKTAAEFQDLVQRNNNTYASIHREALSGTGFCAVAVIPAQKLVLMIIKPNGEAGGLDALRDALFGSGCTLSCFTDGANSTCMAIDGTMVPAFEPADFKDNLIETGFALFLYQLPPATNIRVTFIELKVLDDASALSSGTWTINANVQGTALTLLDQADVDSSDVISMSFDASVTVAPGDDLKIKVTGKDEAGLDDDLGIVDEQFGTGSTPRFGVGRRTRKSSKGHYEVTFEIAILP